MAFFPNPQKRPSVSLREAFLTVASQTKIRGEHLSLPATGPVLVSSKGLADKTRLCALVL